MKRRAMFSALFAPLVLFAKPAHPVNPDKFEYKGLEIRWSGWIARQSQDRLVGYWLANRPNPEELGWYATSTGVVARYQRGWELDFRQMGGWPFIYGDAPEPVKEEVKRDACAALLKALDYNLEKGADAIHPKYYGVTTFKTPDGLKFKFAENHPRMHGRIFGIGDK